MIDASRMNPAKALEGLKQELEKAMLRLNCENKFLKAFNVSFIYLFVFISLYFCLWIVLNCIL